MYNSLQNDDFYSLPKKQSTDQQSNMARYAKMSVLGDIKPSSTLGNIKYGDSISNFHSELSRMAGN
jgi:hypothetical protein